MKQCQVCGQMVIVGETCYHGQIVVTSLDELDIDTDIDDGRWEWEDEEE